VNGLLGFNADARQEGRCVELGVLFVNAQVVGFAEYGVELRDVQILVSTRVDDEVEAAGLVQFAKSIL